MVSSQICLSEASSLVGLAFVLILRSSLTESQSTITFIKHPNSQTVKAGSPVTLVCLAQFSNRRKVSYQWLHNNSTINTDLEPRFRIIQGGSLQISPTDLDDQGTYQCIASPRGRGRVVGKSRVATLTVEGICNKAAILTRPAGSTTFQQGSDLLLRCKCRSSSLGVVRWNKDGVNIRPQQNRRITLDRRKLYINKTTTADSGNYTCYLTVGNVGTAKSPKVQIWIGSSPRIHLHPPDNVKVMKGQRLFMDCAAKGNPPPKLNWFYVGPAWFQLVKHKITSDSKYKICDNGTLIIKNVGSGDTGFYECEARNVIGSTSKKIKLYIPVTFITKPRNKTVLFGKSAWFHCNATGIPKPGISWTRQQGSMDSTRFKQYPSGALHVRNVRLSDSGQYVCTADNTEDVQETSFTLTVTESHVIRLSQSHKYSIAAFLGLNRRITCEFLGRPPITVKWSKAGADTLPARIQINRNSLIFHSIQLGDTGKYICNASNGYSSYTSYVNVTVYDPIRFVLTPRNVTAIAGDSVWFHCQVTGSPTPKVTWLKFKQGVKSLNTERHKIFTNGSLNIKNVQKTDGGRYFCIAATKADLKQISVSLEVKDKRVSIRRGAPGKPVKGKTSSTDSFNLSCYVVILILSAVSVNTA